MDRNEIEMLQKLDKVLGGRKNNIFREFTNCRHHWKWNDEGGYHNFYCTHCGEEKPYDA